MMLNRGISIGSGLVGLGGSEADTEVCNPAHAFCWLDGLHVLLVSCLLVT